MAICCHCEGGQTIYSVTPSIKFSEIGPQCHEYNCYDYNLLGYEMKRVAPIFAKLSTTTTIICCSFLLLIVWVVATKKPLIAMHRLTHNCLG